MCKRLIDVILSLLVLGVLSPLLATIWVLIRVTSHGPGLFVQMRVGLKGEVFGMYKFRTMVENAADIGSFQTAHNDPRITKLGHFLRKSSFDEVPQLINVLKGDMSLVGPRPDTPMQRNLYTTVEWCRRTSVRPGITGLAQVTYRSLGNHEDRLTMDLDYIERQNFWLDCKILMMTFGKLTGRGVN